MVEFIESATNRQSIREGGSVPHGMIETLFEPIAVSERGRPSVLFVGSMDGRKRGRFLLDGFLNSHLSTASRQPR